MPLLHLVKVGHEFNLTISSAEKVLKEAKNPKISLAGPPKQASIGKNQNLASF